MDSTEEEKGSDCLESFRAMQQCFTEHPEHYKVLPLCPCARGDPEQGCSDHSSETGLQQCVRRSRARACPVLALARPGLNSSAPDAPQEFLEGPDDEEDEAPKSEEDKRKEAQEWQAHNFAK